MSIDEYIEQRVREIVREELASSYSGQGRRFTPEQLAERWHTNEARIRALANAGQLKAIRLSERVMCFSLEEVLRFEENGGIAGLKAVA